MIEPKEKPCRGINKAKSYKGCGTPTLYRTYGLCNHCLGDFLFGNDNGKLLMQRSVLPKAKAIVKKEQKAKDNKKRESLKTLSQYEAEAKKSFQHYIRLRDADLPCISCNETGKDIWDGGHFFKAELYSGLIFDERNCHKQCRQCNRYYGGNEIQYRMGLVNRFGAEFVQKLEEDSVSKRVYKYSKQELIAKKMQYDIKIKEFKTR